MLRQLHRLHNAAVGAQAGEHHAGGLHRLPVVVVKLKPVAMALVDQVLAVALSQLGADFTLQGKLPSPQGAALVPVLVLAGHVVYDLVQALWGRTPRSWRL